jgi:hypothetical protein
LKKEIPPRCLWCVIITTKSTLSLFRSIEVIGKMLSYFNRF